MSDARLLDDADKNLWTDYVNRHPDATLDHCWEWRDILQKSFRFQPFYLGSFTNHRLNGILPLFRVPRGLGRWALVSIPYSNYGGICADTPDATHALIRSAKELMPRLKCADIAFHHRTPVDSSDLQQVCNKARFYRQVTIEPEEMIFKNLPKKVRNRVRYATRNGMTLQQSRNSTALYAIHVDQFRRLGTPCFPKSYFDLTLAHFGDAVEIHYAVINHEPIAFNFAHYFRSSLLVTAGNSLRKTLDLSPNDFLYWHGVRIAAARGLTEFDLCRSTRGSGPALHKLRLDLKESPLAYQYLTSKKIKPDPSTPKNNKFGLAIKVWQRLPLPLTQTLGPKVVRYFA